MQLGKKKNKPDARNNKIKSFNYHSTRWRRIRMQVLQRDRYMCQCTDCKNKGLITPANTVDHIDPIELGGDPWSLDNMQSMSKRCHDKKSSGERRNIKR